MILFHNLLGAPCGGVEEVPGEPPWGRMLPKEEWLPKCMKSAYKWCRLEACGLQKPFCRATDVNWGLVLGDFRKQLKIWDLFGVCFERADIADVATKCVNHANVDMGNKC